MLLRHRSSEDRNQGLSTIPCEDAKGEERVCKYSVGETCLTPNLFQVWGTRNNASDEIDFADIGYEVGFVGLFQQLADGGAAFVAVVDGPVVDVHADELVG